MDEFIIKTVLKGPSKPIRNSHLTVNIDANKRARKYPKGTFHVDGRLRSMFLLIMYEKSVVGKHL